MATQAQFANAPNVVVTAFSTANTNRDGTGTIALAFTPGANGSRIERIQFKATGTTTAGMVRLFYSTDAGVTWRLLKELSVSAITPSATVQSFDGSLTFGNAALLVLTSGHRLGVSTHNAEAFVATAIGADL
jgi:hypothetical protein